MCTVSPNPFKSLYCGIACVNAMPRHLFADSSVTNQLVKAALRSVVARAYWASPHFLASLTGKALILTYHRVMAHADVTATFVQPAMYVTPETFEDHLRFLTAHFRLVTFRDLLAQWEGRTWDHTARYCAITLDDGWLDNYVYAYPLLRAYGVPATIFLPTDMIGTSEWFWPDRLGYLLHQVGSQDLASVRREALGPLARHYSRLASLKRPEESDSVIELTKTISDEDRDELLRGLQTAAGTSAPAGRRLLNWDEVREMSRGGITFGSHTCTHAILTRLDSQALERELVRPLQVFDEQRVNYVPVLSYPNGNHTERVVAAARAAGYRAAVTTQPGLESNRPADLFRLKRVGVHDDVSRSIPLLSLHIAREAW